MKKEVNSLIELPGNFISNKANKSITLTQQRLLLYSCFLYDENSGNTTIRFSRKDYESTFNVHLNSFKVIREELQGLFNFNYSFIDEEKQSIKLKHVFQDDTSFEDGVFTIIFNPYFKKQIKETKQQFLQYGFDILVNWNCKYTTYLYNYLKEKMFQHDKHDFTLEEFRSLFKLDKKEYLNNTDFKFYVWSKAVKEINDTTGYKISVIPNGRGKKTIYTLTIESREKLILKKNDVAPGQTSIDDFIGYDEEPTAVVSTTSSSTNDDEYNKETLESLMNQIENKKSINHSVNDVAVIEEIPTAPTITHEEVEKAIPLTDEKEKIDVDNLYCKMFGYPYIPTKEQLEEYNGEPIPQNVYDNIRLKKGVLNKYFGITN